MAEKYRNKYRIESARAQWWDYGWNGAYFITICTHNREHFFGEIHNGIMNLSRLGVIADILWHEIPNHSPFTDLGEFVVMPNHIHGILILDKPTPESKSKSESQSQSQSQSESQSVQTGHALSQRSLNSPKKSPSIALPQRSLNPPPKSQSKSLPQRSPNSPKKSPSIALPQRSPNPPPDSKSKSRSKKTTPGQNRYQNIGKNSISSIIGSYKSAVTKHANRLNLPNGWQTRFHDHIIRSEAEFRRIATYIKNNPKKWEEDKFKS